MNIFKHSINLRCNERQSFFVERRMGHSLLIEKVEWQNWLSMKFCLKFSDILPLIVEINRQFRGDGLPFNFLLGRNSYQPLNWLILIRSDKHRDFNWLERRLINKKIHERSILVLKRSEKSSLQLHNHNGRSHP